MLKHVTESTELGPTFVERRKDRRRLAAQYATARVLAESATLAQAVPAILQAICESLD